MMRSFHWRTACLTLIAFLFLLPLPAWAVAVTRDDVLKLLNNPFQKKLFQNTYESLVHRVAPDGYLPESLTGAYPGMFPRTVGPYVFLMLEKHQWRIAKKVLRYTLEATALSHLHRVPHVIGRAYSQHKPLVIPVINDQDQPDGQYSVILAWARYVATTHDTAFENATYNQVARLTNLATNVPYLNINTSLTTDLVRNPSFEDSREGRFWDTYDLLTQVFTAESWREMIPVAKARGDMAHVDKWQTALNELEYGIRHYLTRRLGGKLIYAEMRLPNGYGGKIYTGLSWVNLSPIAAGWKRVNPKILNATVAAYRKRATFQWDGFHILGCEWNPPGVRHIYTVKKSGWVITRKPIRRARINYQLIGKQWAWEFLYSVQQKQWSRACHLLEFLRKAYKWPVFAESFWFQPKGKVAFSDPGNAEQCSWYCWAITTARKILTAYTPN